MVRRHLLWSTIIGAIAACPPAKPGASSKVNVRLVLRGVPADAANVGFRTWSSELGLGVAPDARRRECDRPWWKTPEPCEVSIVITAEKGLREQIGHDGDTNLELRAIRIDTRVLANRTLLWTVIAHELGHVFLNTSEHTADGVMGSKDWVLHDGDRALIQRTVKRR